MKLKIEIKSKLSQAKPSQVLYQMETDNTPAANSNTKLAPIQQRQAIDNDTLSNVNLSNQKMDNSEIDIGEPSELKYFSKTTTNEFLAISN